MAAYLDSNLVTAIATSVYGAATLLLVIQLWRDRAQRERHFKNERDAKKLSDLHGAFYEAWGYWEGHQWGRGSVQIDASQVGRQFESLVRLECQLRLNGHVAEANDLGLAIRTDLSAIKRPLERAGIALGLVPSEYRYGKGSAAGFANK